MKTKYSLLLILFLASCAPLSKSQLKMSNNYYESIANYPRYYRELNVAVADLDLEAKNLKSSLQTTDTERIETIINSINEYEDAMRLPDSIQVHTRYIDQYVQDYYSLIPNGFSIYRTLKGTTETIGGIFGLGGVVSGILPSNPSSINPTKRRKIQEQVLTSGTELRKSLTILRNYIDKSFIPRLEYIDRQSIEDFERLLESINNSTPPLEYYTRHNRMLTDFYQRLYRTKSLVKQLSKAIDSFMVVEKELTDRFAEKANIDIEETHLNELINDMQRINYLMHDLDDYKQKSTL
ncbi:MAG: hypothetical protein RLN88_10780 [Ekhidna sp.]|uniref:hypothetical protein n=1 Tax=Ekhidna sp. TaxID=2608089 RepID=UPI0032EB7317